MDDKVSLFSGLIGSGTIELSPLAESGSNRKYYRLKDLSAGREVIAVYNEDVRENEAFINLDKALASCGVRVPHVIAVSADRMAYLQEDLGNTSLYDVISRCKANPAEVESARLLSSLLDDCMRQLARIHWVASPSIDFSRCYPVGSMTARDILWDLNYCKYCFFRPVYAEFDEARLQDDFDKLCQRMLEAIGMQPSRVFMYRDFQSRNVMVKDGAAWFIDFQGGRAGLFLYDVVSFLWQGRAGFSADERLRLVDVYFDEAARIMPEIDRGRFVDLLPDVVLFRSLQVLGTYCFRGLYGKKKTF